MKNPSVYYFPDKNHATVTEVGGKGLSLIQGCLAGLPVPSGFILSVSFFQPWFQELQKTENWKKFIQPEKFDLKKSSVLLKEKALTLSLTSEQKNKLAKALQKYPKTMLFAVRSSSPEEDLEGASFAGGYETILGVNIKNMENAVKKAFASCLDYRVAIYKKEHGFNIEKPEIAVIVQEQIPSEIAGVGFSINPVTNNFDEAVFTANFGLGETVVQGIVTPDTYIVNKLLLQIIHKQLGAKETSIWLLGNGGTKERKNKTNNEFSLSDSQVLELTKLISKVALFYNKPVDIEWAFAKEKLYLLQARPITGFVPLSPNMLTKPGDKKQLYLDVTIGVQGITHPLSVMATSLFTHLIKNVGHMFFNRDLNIDNKTTPAFIDNGRMFLNLSVLLQLLGEKRLQAFLRLFDPLSATAFSEIETNQYIATHNKYSLLPRKLSLYFPFIVTRIIKARLNPEKMHMQTQKELQEFVTKAKAIADQKLPMTTLADALLQTIIHRVILKTVPLFLLAEFTKSELQKIAGNENQELFNQLDSALPNNITTQMGLALFRVSQVLPSDLNLKKLTKGILDSTLRPSFLESWNDFVSIYGFRGPEEIDIAAPRYRENPAMLLDILLTLKKSGKNTREQFEINQQKRKQAFNTLYQTILSKDQKQAKRFFALYTIYETFAGYREVHKYYIALIVDLLRQRVLNDATILCETKRLDHVEQVFDLTLEQLDAAFKDTSLDLKALTKTNRIFIDRLAKLQHLPTLIDSRGLIIKPHTQPKKNDEIIGMAVSPGIARGKIKILHSPAEKSFLKGEILVARATDPGWTPLFVNASAVILEIGGMLQHGALVAREYGLPCVTGIENATTLWKDGTLVEVDGSEGIVRVIKNS